MLYSALYYDKVRNCDNYKLTVGTDLQIQTEWSMAEFSGHFDGQDQIITIDIRGEGIARGRRCSRRPVQECAVRHCWACNRCSNTNNGNTSGGCDADFLAVKSRGIMFLHAKISACCPC